LGVGLYPIAQQRRSDLQLEVQKQEDDVLRSTTKSSMKNKSIRPLVFSKPSEDEIRDYAYHLYQRSNCAPGQDLGNWLEAIACLNAKRSEEHTSELQSLTNLVCRL